MQRELSSLASSRFWILRETPHRGRVMVCDIQSEVIATYRMHHRYNSPSISPASSMDLEHYNASQRNVPHSGRANLLRLYLQAANPSPSNELHYGLSFLYTYMSLLSM